VDRSTLAGIKIALAVAAIALAWIERRWPTQDRRTRLAWALLALAAVGFYYRFNPAAVTRRYDAYDLVHYYLNSKYFPELGYTRLYQACLVADQEDRGRLARITSLRDLYDQQVKSGAFVRDVRAHPERIKQHFSKRRWSRFKRDVRILDKALKYSTWRRILVDRGYNATPTWHALGHALASRIPARHVKWLCHIDTLLVIGMFWVIAWCQGRRAMLVAVVWFCCSFSSAWPGVGWAMLRYDWLALAVAGACLLARGHRFWGGAAIGWAALSRIFPAVLLLFLCVRGVHRLVRHRTLDRDALRIAAGFVVVVAVGSAITWSVLGSGHYRAFAHDLDIQLAPENLSVNRMGLAIGLAYRGETSERELPLSKRRDRYLLAGRYGSTRTALGLALLAVLAASVLWPPGSSRPAREEVDLAQLGFYGFALLLTASFYYWTLRVLAVLLHDRHRDRSRWDLAGLCALFGIEIWSHGFELATKFRYGVTATSSIAISLYAAVVCIVRGTASWRRRAGARA